MDPTKEEFLAVVSEWSGYGHQSASLVGNAYPLYSLSSKEVVERPLEQFPNPGYIFLVNRGELTTWDFVRIRPGLNKKYKNAQHRECYYISMSTPTLLEGEVTDLEAAVLLDVTNFDPASASNVIRNPAQGVTPVFFVRNVQQRIYGPLQRVQTLRNRMDNLEAIQWEPFGHEGFVYELTLEDLGNAGLRLVTYEHPEQELNQVVERPFNLLVGPVLEVESSRVIDRLPDDQLAEWYLRKIKKYPEVPEELLKVLQDAPEILGSTPTAIIRQRCRRLADLFASLDVLQSERRNAARRFLMDTEEGKQVLEQQLALEVSRRAKSLEEEVRARREELAVEKEQLDTQLEEIQNRKQSREQELENELDHLVRKREEMKSLLEEVQHEIANNVEGLADQMKGQFPMLAALSMGMRTAVPQVNVSGHTSVAHNNAHAVTTRSGWGTEVRPVEPTKELDEIREENAFVDQLVAELAAQQLSFTRDFVANLFVCLKSSSLNLITGPPGHGKSSVIAGLARALGHGNAFLDIAVRRSWSDDRYLLGFFDTFHGRYDPGPTGLATRLLQAQCDWEQAGDGIYLILLDEFNLAAPEYYFSQLLQVLPRPAVVGRVSNPEHNGTDPVLAQEPRVVRLFDPSTIHAATADTISEITLHPNVFFWGTINYDETTERLSPRLLDRTGMVFLTAGDVSRSLTMSEAQAQRIEKGIRARQLTRFVRDVDECPDEMWDRIEPLMELLRKQSDAFGSGLDLSPRVIEGIKRYLANSEGILSPTRAVDFVFQQRVLPVLRGRGPKYAARMQALREQLASDGLNRSARHVSDAITSADLNFGDIDFFAY